MRALKKTDNEFKDDEPFKGLFTQGMVCHETYKDKDGKWLSPNEIEKDQEGNFIKISDKTKVLVGPSESMSKSKKNVVDPESMIKSYGADAVRWFILSDSPPEKDIQWSNQGVNAAYKFLQKIYNLNNIVINNKNKKNTYDNNLDLKINSYINKITSLINNFNLNVVVANVYEIYNIFNDYLNKDVSGECLRRNIVKLMKVLIPFTPHLSHECLEMLGITGENKWPSVDQKLIEKEKIKIAIQFNGKTRDVLEVEKDLNEKEIVKLCNNNIKLKERIKIKNQKVIFVKNRIINFIEKK